MWSHESVHAKNFVKQDFARSFKRLTISRAFHAWAERPATLSIILDGEAYWGLRNVEAVLKDNPQRSSLRVDNEAVAEASE